MRRGLEGRMRSPRPLWCLRGRRHRVRGAGGRAASPGKEPPAWKQACGGLTPEYTPSLCALRVPSRRSTGPQFRGSRREPRPRGQATARAIPGIDCCLVIVNTQGERARQDLAGILLTCDYANNEPSSG
jgi:hypothetical protein